MPVCNLDLQQRCLVGGINDPRVFFLQTVYAGQALNLDLRALLPSGNPAPPYDVEVISSAVVTLTIIDGAILVQSAVWGAVGDHLTGGLAIPASVTFPSGQNYALCRLAFDLTIAGVVHHIETPVTLRLPAAPLTLGFPAEPAGRTLWIVTADGTLTTVQFPNGLIPVTNADGSTSAVYV